MEHHYSYCQWQQQQCSFKPFDAQETPHHSNKEVDCHQHLMMQAASETASVAALAMFLLEIVCGECCAARCQLCKLSG